MEPISKEDQETFCLSEFSQEDSVASGIAAYCPDFPERLFPAALSPSAITFKDERYHNGVHIAVDLGGALKTADICYIVTGFPFG